MADDKVVAAGMSPEEVALRLFDYVRGSDDAEGRKKTKAEVLRQYAECLNVVAGLSPPER